MINEKWDISFTPKAIDDLNGLDGSLKGQVLKAIDKVSSNPLPQSEGGYGKALGNKFGQNLSGLLKVKLKKSGIRIIYSIKRNDKELMVIIIGVRADNEVYKEAFIRLTR